MGQTIFLILWSIGFVISITQVWQAHIEDEKERHNN